MVLPILPKRKADVLSNGLFLIGIGILFYTNAWWPGILIALWAAFGTRQFFTGRYYDLGISTLILMTLFVISFFNIKTSVILPVLFIVGGIYIIFREYYFAEGTVEDNSENIKDDIDDGK
jgi:threonine/homoserine/homoserine lactone efflux protein